MLAFTSQRLITPTETIENPVLLVEEGRILDLAPRRARAVPAGLVAFDFSDGILAPGYVDLHIHGGAGFDVMSDAAEALPSVEQLLARHGVTSYYPTTVTAPMEATLRALGRLADAIEEREHQPAPEAARACPAGIHLEGPFLSHARRGVHPPEHLLKPTSAAFERFWDAARGRIRMLTIAPELEGAMEVIAEASRRGVCVSLGHTDADLRTSERGIEAGARHATHTFNAMRPLNHRDPGILGAVLTDARVSADIIADGVHLDPAIVRLFAHAKGAQQTVLITDATAATGMPDGTYRLGSLEVEVRDGRCTSDGKLAGSLLTMDRAIRNLAQFASWTLEQAVAAASLNPARIGGLSDKGALKAGADADFVVLNAAGEVKRTFVGGVEAGVGR
ncbi:MAG: N-acetylglucosamine-6-phosphate deacetylase [Acidobacteriia bacterium]|nr:N-acetylglucosamine-6-phosphate deacetylase [Terriglobia bacterium]